MARTSQRPLKRRWNYVGPEARDQRPRMAMTWLDGIDTLETYELKRKMKHYQNIAVRDMQNFSEARLVAVLDDGTAVMETHSDKDREIRTWHIDPEGKRTFKGARPD